MTRDGGMSGAIQQIPFAIIDDPSQGQPPGRRCKPESAYLHDLVCAIDGTAGSAETLQILTSDIRFRTLTGPLKQQWLADFERARDHLNKVILDLGGAAL